MMLPAFSWRSAIKPGGPWTAAVMAGSCSPKNEMETPSRDAAYQPLIGSAIRNRYSRPCPAFAARASQPRCWGGAGQAQDQPGQHQHEHRKPQRKVEQRRIVDHLAAAFGGQPGTENQRAVSQ